MFRYKTSNEDFKAIKDWREDERPRERLIKHGASSLSDSELLAILIGSGAIGFSALDAARTLLEEHSSLTRLSSCDLSQLKKVHGVGDAKAVTLAAAFEIGKRIETEPFQFNDQIKTPEDIANLFIPKMRNLRKEVFHVILLNSASNIFRDVVVSEGILNSSVVHPREVFRLAITETAASIILLHNHPSGSKQPSREDIEITKQMCKAGNLLGIKVIDHIIVAGETYTSFAREGLL